MCFRDLFRVPPGHAPKNVFQAWPSGPRRRLRTHWRVFISWLTSECLESLWQFWRKCLWRKSPLGLMSTQPSNVDQQQKMDERIWCHKYPTNFLSSSSPSLFFWSYLRNINIKYVSFSFNISLFPRAVCFLDLWTFLPSVFHICCYFSHPPAITSLHLSPYCQNLRHHAWKYPRYMQISHKHYRTKVVLSFQMTYIYWTINILQEKKRLKQCLCSGKERWKCWSE